MIDDERRAARVIIELYPGEAPDVWPEDRPWLGPQLLQALDQLDELEESYCKALDSLSTSARTAKDLRAENDKLAGLLGRINQ